MRHRKAGRQFGRNTSHRRAMFRALTANLVAHERIETTDAKAKELRRVAERVVTRAKRLGPLAYTPHKKLKAADVARRQAVSRHIGKFLQRFAVVQEAGEKRKVDLIEKVMTDLAKRYEKRAGGYTRIIKLGRRRGDNAPMSLIEFVDRPDKAAAKEADEKKAAPHAATTVTQDKGEASEAKAKPAEAAEPKAEEKKPTKAKAPAKKAAAKAEKAEAKKEAPASKKASAKKTAKKASAKADASAGKKAPAKKTAKKKTSKK